MLKKDTKLTYKCKKDELFDIVKKVIEDESSMEVEMADEKSGYITLAVGMSIWSWGEKMNIVVTEKTEIETEITFESASNYAIVDYGKNRKNIDKIVKGISKHLN